LSLPRSRQTGPDLGKAKRLKTSIVDVNGITTHTEKEKHGKCHSNQEPAIKGSDAEEWKVGDSVPCFGVVDKGPGIGVPCDIEVDVEEVE